MVWMARFRFRPYFMWQTTHYAIAIDLVSWHIVNKVKFTIYDRKWVAFGVHI